jgi:cytochrome c
MKSILAAAAFLALASSPAWPACDTATADAAKGEKKFALCKACHVVADKVNKIGPHIDGIIDRPIAAVADYAYSENMKELAATGAKWDIATLDAYLKKPKEVVPKGKMAFAGIPKDEDRCNVITFLSTKPAL